MQIDETALPERCALDSGVLLLALNQRSHRDAAATCRALWSALLASERIARGARVFIPALVVAELARGSSPADIPRMAGVQIAPFTAAAARALGTHLPHTFIAAQKEATGLREHYLKYDSLIAATAIVYGATLITLDGWLLGLTTLPVPVRAPEAFVRRQLALPAV